MLLCKMSLFHLIIYEHNFESGYMSSWRCDHIPWGTTIEDYGNDILRNDSGNFFTCSAFIIDAPLSSSC